MLKKNIFYDVGIIISQITDCESNYVPIYPWFHHTVYLFNYAWLQNTLSLHCMARNEYNEGTIFNNNTVTTDYMWHNFPLRDTPIHCFLNILTLTPAAITIT